MTSFSSAGALMPLDVYYDHCVLPKPNIPKRYPGVIGNAKKKREAARLQSYKDNAEDDDDEEIEEDEEEMEVERKHVDEFDSSIQDSNMNQIDYETNEFNMLYEETKDVKDKIDQNPATAVSETPAGSAQWRIQPNNVNRPPGAAPLIPTNAPRGNLQSAAGRAGRGIRKKRFYPNNNNNNNNRNNSPNSVHNRLGYNAQRGRFPMRNNNNLFNNSNNNPFNNNNNNNTNNNNYNGNPQQQVLMNMNNQFQNGQAQINLSSQMNSMQQHCQSQINPIIGRQFTSYMNPNSNSNEFNNSSNNLISSNSVTSLVSSANQIGNCSYNHNNALSRLGPQSRSIPQSVNLSYGNMIQPNCNSQLQCVPNRNNGIAVSDSLRLADLMNMDKNSCKNLNVAEVAKNAMLLLSSVYHKPILNEDVQQELSHLQQNNGLPEEPYGLEMEIKPEFTDQRFYHRFK
ncbi:GATA zinc finger domain-containing protein 4 [Drosophila innubila]|uniref:GATA zinc finger domain-containing protein 4 n=1 Tax=Drosophila innubila TaxID=198719 RepID=UPI00148DCABA|nr:GATA zinc finger domain-containing protein 4 [Drosophila innubila]XP_034476446.1 GATA zinc finger domain-containing protein 4 [Drosophila innubila]